jgi:DNA-binding NarL/FixJ family response regulator
LVIGVAVDGIVGRDVELDRLRLAISEVAAGRGGAVWVGGEPGIGKSTLVDVALGETIVGDMRVFRGAADELTQPVPLRTMANCLGIDHEAVDGFRMEIADVLAGRVGRVDAVRAASEQMVALVQRECAASPVVVVADDLQWTDEASLLVWQRLAELTVQTPLLMVGLGRPVPQRDVIDRLRRTVDQTPDGAVFELGPLDGDAVTAMVAGRLSALPGPSLRAWLHRAGGNPLYVREMLDALTADGLVRIDGGVAELAGPVEAGLTTVSAAIAHRLDFLSDNTRSVLRAATILGGRFTLDELAVVSGKPVAALVDIKGEAVAAGVLADGGPELTFRHGLILQALNDELPRALRVGLHAHMARVLADAGAAWVRVAKHLLAAPEAVDDDWALAWLTGLPATTLYALPAIAADLLSRARRASKPGDPRRASFTARLSTVLRLLRRPNDLIALGEEALATISDPCLTGEIAWNLGRAYQAVGRGEDGQRVIARVLGGPDPGAPWRSRLRAQRALILVFSGKAEDSAEESRLAIAEGERDGDPVTVGWALHAMLTLTANDMDFLKIVDRGLSVVVGADAESIDLRLVLQANRLVALSNMDRLAEFETALAESIALAESQGSPRLDMMQRTAAYCYLEHGDWDRALFHLDQFAEALTNDLALLKSGAAALIAMCRDDRATAQRHIAAVAHIPYLGGLESIMAAKSLTLARALLAEAAGDPRTAIELMSVWLDPRVQGNPHFRVGRAEVLPDMVRVALAAGDRVTAQAVVAAIEADAQANDDVNLTIRAAICRAMVEDLPASLMAAADHYDHRGRRPEACFALQEAAVRLAIHGDLPAAREAFDRAVTIYGSLGAVLDLRRMQARLRPYGIRSGSHAPHRRATTGWHALTATEREVAALVAKGGSNPEIATRLFVSPRTVETHVAHIVAKLQVRSRRDIARELARHSPAGSASEGTGTHANK